MQKWRAQCKKLKTLLLKWKHLILAHKWREQELESWKIEKKSFLLEDEQGRISSDQIMSLEFDTEVIEDFLKWNLHKLPDSYSKREFEDMIGFYLEKSAWREHQI